MVTYVLILTPLEVKLGSDLSFVLCFVGKYQLTIALDDIPVYLGRSVTKGRLKLETQRCDLQIFITFQIFIRFLQNKHCQLP